MPRFSPLKIKALFKGSIGGFGVNNTSVLSFLGLGGWLGEENLVEGREPHERGLIFLHAMIQFSGRWVYFQS